MKTIQHLCALAIITVIMGTFYEAVQQFNGSRTSLRMIFLGWVVCTALVTFNWLAQFYQERKKIFKQ